MNNKITVFVILNLFVLTLFIVWLAPGFLVQHGLPMTPPWTGQRCEDVYESHFEFTGEVWCDLGADRNGCNGAVCKHLWSTLDLRHIPKEINFYPVSYCYCK